MTALLVIIYASFISLGLPDSLLGASWPSMYGTLNVPVSYAGVISMIVSGGTIISSLISDRVILRLGTGRVTAISVLMTAAALLLFSVSTNFFAFCVLAVPLGLGAGSVDTALNNFVALHYKARHMSWLHCFWGIGATAGPVVMGLALSRYHSWALGYRAIGVVQAALAAVLFAALPLWKKARAQSAASEDAAPVHLPVGRLAALPGAKAAMGAFFAYCSLESTVGLWGASFLVFARGVGAENAASFVSLFFFGIMAGRLLSGFLTMRFSQRMMIRMGEGLLALGILTLFLFAADWLSAAGLFLIGFGCAPIFPSLLHETPVNFGKAHSQQIIGFQMACAYTGSTLMPPLFGLLAGHVSYTLLPFALALYCLLLFLLTETLNRRARGETA